MNQTPLELGTLSVTPVDRTGFDIGWDHGHHGLVPPPELLHADTPVYQGWMAAKAVFGRRTLASQRSTRQWLQLRLLAWRRGIAFDTQQLTPNFLRQIHTERCPVRRCALGGPASHPDAAVVERLNPQAGYAAGNLAVMSAQAAAACAGTSAMQAARHARAAEACGEAVQGLDAATWWRVAALGAFATPLPFAEVARLPLAVLPPNRVRLLNAAQGLQALVTLLFTAPGWSDRCRAFGLLLPAHTLRHDFNLFVGAMAPRVLEAGNDSAALRHALEDAWLLERVQRRWMHLVLSLGEAATEALLARAAEAPVPGVRILCHAPDQAVEGWALPQAGCTPPHAVKRDVPVTRRTARLSGMAIQAGRQGTVPPPAAPARHA